MLWGGIQQGSCWDGGRARMNRTQQEAGGGFWKANRGVEICIGRGESERELAWTDWKGIEGSGDPQTLTFKVADLSSLWPYNLEL